MSQGVSKPLVCLSPGANHRETLLTPFLVGV
jgi:hypothetical protein